MANVGFTPPSATTGCGMAGMATGATAGGLRPALGQASGGGFAFPQPDATAAMSPFGGERFISSSMGGVIVGKDGAPAGRVPAGSFIDTTDGTVYGADGKAITLPEGATIDFFDLPDLDQLVPATTAGGGAPGKTAATTSVAGASGPGDAAPMKTAVEGQWGPGGVTAFKGGGGAGAMGEDCGMDHGVRSTGARVRAGGPGGIQRQAAAALAQLQAMGVDPAGDDQGWPPIDPSTLGGGLATGVAGARGLGQIPSLQSSLVELIRTLRELTSALQVRGGGPPKDLPASPGTPPTKAATASTAPSDSSTAATSTTATTATTPPAATTATTGDSATTSGADASSTTAATS